MDDVSYYSTIPDLLEFDIGYIRTSLQYAEDWKGTLKELVKCNPNLLIFSDLSVGDIKTFLTLQSWGSQDIPYWFINKDELVEFVLSFGYKLTCDKISGYIKDREGWESCKNYPREFQITCLFDLVFERV